MDRRTALGSGLAGIATFLGGGLAGGFLGYRESHKEVRAVQKEMRAQLTFDQIVKEVNEELDMDAGQYYPVELEGSHPVTGEPRRYEYRAESSAPIDVLLMTVENFLAYREGNDYEIIGGGSSLNTDMATGSGLIPSTFSWLVVDNTTEGRAQPIPSGTNVDFSLTVRE